MVLECYIINRWWLDCPKNIWYYKFLHIIRYIYLFIYIHIRIYELTLRSLGEILERNIRISASHSLDSLIWIFKWCNLVKDIVVLVIKLNALICIAILALLKRIGVMLRKMYRATLKEKVNIYKNVISSWVLRVTFIWA